MRQLPATFRAALPPLALLAGSLLAAPGALAADEAYWGLSVGRTDSDARCGSAIYDCDRRDTAFKLSYGKPLMPFFGGEVQYFDGGTLQRGGGDTRTKAVDLFLVGRLPMGAVTPFVKLGTSLARTETSSGPLSDIPGGKATGWGPSGGLGASLDFGASWAAVAEWERRRVEYAGEGRHDVDTASAGLRYRF